MRVLIALAVLLCLAPARADTFDSAGFAIHYEVLAEGPEHAQAVVLIHGYLRDHTDWANAPTTAALARTHRVIAIDVRGHGRSQRSTDPDDHGDAAVEDVARLLDHLHVERADIVGYSMGGLIALRLAVLHPDRVDEVVVGGAGFDAEFDKAFDEQIRTLAGDMRAGRGLARLFTFIEPEGTPPLPPEVIERINAEVFAVATPEQWAASLEGFLDWQYTPGQLSACAVPIAFVCSDRDPFIAAARGSAKAMPRATLIELKGFTHGEAMGTPAFTNAVTGFIKPGIVKPD